MPMKRNALGITRDEARQGILPWRLLAPRRVVNTTCIGGLRCEGVSESCYEGKNEKRPFHGDLLPRHPALLPGTGRGALGDA